MRRRTFLPSFTAERSLGSSARHYRSARRQSSSLNPAFFPQQDLMVQDTDNNRGGRDDGSLASSACMSGDSSCTCYCGANCVSYQSTCWCTKK
jgi:hypothetical protein